MQVDVQPTGQEVAAELTGSGGFNKSGVLLETMNTKPVVAVVVLTNFV